jgi:hypothetical protein
MFSSDIHLYLEPKSEVFGVVNSVYRGFGINI